MTRLFARSFLLQLITLCTAIGVLWAPVAEAAECADEPEVASLIEQHGEPGDEGDALGEARALWLLRNLYFQPPAPDVARLVWRQ